MITRVCTLLETLGFYRCKRPAKRISTTRMPSTFDQFKIDMAHNYDDVLEKLFQRLHFHPAIKDYNPEPHEEAKAFQEIGGSMVDKNARLLSRIFIKNAEKAQLKESFADIKLINILDIGCGNAHNLMGIFAYLGEENVNYSGVDLDSKKIHEAQQTYREFKNTEFINEDALTVLTDAKNVNKFDLVLIQHPNLTTSSTLNDFIEILLRADKVCAAGGRIYITFYYQHEIKFFNKHVKPNMNLEGTIYLNKKLNSGFTLCDRDGKKFFPETAVFMSEKNLLKEVRLEGRMSAKLA